MKYLLFFLYLTSPQSQGRVELNGPLPRHKRIAQFEEKVKELLKSHDIVAGKFEFLEPYPDNKESDFKILFLEPLSWKKHLLPKFTSLEFTRDPDVSGPPGPYLNLTNSQTPKGFSFLNAKCNALQIIESHASCELGEEYSFKGSILSKGLYVVFSSELQNKSPRIDYIWIVHSAPMILGKKFSPGDIIKIEGDLAYKKVDNVTNRFGFGLGSEN